MNKSIKDSLIIGLALFAMFFGSGNLIFPPYLGKTVGSDFFTAILGFVITGVGLPLMGILACAKINGSFKEMSNPIGKAFSIIVTTSIILAIGPMLAIPRTAATTYELSILPLFPNAKMLPVIIIYFIITLLFVLRPSSLIDNIGKLLTPLLLLILLIIITKGVLSPIGPIVSTNAKNVFSSSLIEGYQTMDAMAAVIFSSIILSSVRAKGYSKVSDIIKITSLSGIIAVIGLGVIYGGLLYLGSQTASIFPNDITKSQLVTNIVEKVLGNTGIIFLSIVVALACLTTSIGLTSSAAKYFSDLFNNKVSYTFNAIIISIVSILIALLGVDTIVALAVPILQILYPIVMVLVILTLMGKLVKNNSVLKATVYTTLIISILDNLKNIGFTISAIANLISYIPLSKQGFSWVIPALIAFVVSSIVTKNKS